MATALVIEDDDDIRRLLEVVLSQAGYVRVTKEKGAPRPRTWVALTAEGRQVTSGHLAALRDIAATVAERH